MFNLRIIETGEWVNIYDIKYDITGYPIFLYYHDNQWKQKSAKYFSPELSDNESKWLMDEIDKITE